MKGELSIKDAIKILVGKQQFASISALVRSTNPDQGKVTVLIEEFDLELEIGLTAFEMNSTTSALIIVPKVGSYILLTRISGSDDFVISGYTEIEKIWMGGKSFSSVKGETIQEQLTKVSSFLAAFKNVLQVTVTEPGGGAPSAFQSALLAALNPLETGDFTNILNGKLKHG